MTSENDDDLILKPTPQDVDRALKAARDHGWLDKDGHWTWADDVEGEVAR